MAAQFNRRNLPQIAPQADVEAVAPRCRLPAAAVRRAAAGAGRRRGGELRRPLQVAGVLR